ncbi:hypothetical protein BSKO_09943 [Bryopsis sp. KO-2023]|nr:hypothetical protein BSKO_09943 [Bryopsis sp. KO-2023]
MSSTRNPHACTLAKNILRDFYGDIVATVCDSLLKRGRQNFRELLRASGLSPEQLREGLLVLVQHNCVSCYKLVEDGFRGAIKVDYVYDVHIDKILQILRKPWFLLHIRDEMGEIAERVVEGLVETGRLRLDQVISSVAGQTGESAEAVKDKTVQALVSLIRAHYVERAPPCDLPLKPEKSHPSAQKKKSAKVAKQEADREAGIMSAYGVYQRERFRLPPSLLSLSMDSLFGEDDLLVKEDTAKEKAGDKRKRRRSDNDGGDDAEVVDDADVLWRVNFEEFNRAFRHQACVDIVENKLNKNAAFALKCMLEATRASESTVNEAVSRQVSEAEIGKASEQLAERMKDTPDDLREALEQLREDQLEFVTYLGMQAGGEVYVVNMERIIECTQLVEVETAIRDRFSMKGLRVFRLLLLRKHLEQKQVSDLAMLDSKEARSLLYQMLKAGYVHVQDIPRGADHAASRTIYTWRVSLEEARRQFIDDLYRGLHNCHCRLMDELRKGNELLELLELAQGENEVLNITESQRKGAMKLSQTVRTLEAQLLRLDHLTAVMTDFSQ